MTWVEGAAGSLHDVDNLPYGVVVRPGEKIPLDGIVEGGETKREDHPCC